MEFVYQINVWMLIGLFTGGVVAYKALPNDLEKRLRRGETVRIGNIRLSVDSSSNDEPPSGPFAAA